MNKIIRTITFTLVLAGLLAWGAVTVAQVPGTSNVASSITANEIQIEQSIELNAIPASDRSGFRRVGQ
ncbi:hypothetical protein KAU08_02295 [bacterium]|nr:hypothetical protein [bacterium]